MKNEEEERMIRLIYEKYLSVIGVGAVAKWLNNNGYTKTVKQNGTVPLISAHFVKGVLDNPVYADNIA
ncbi:recombinase family protein [Clostridium perfringens]|uniref:recombinase family protein n=1 Tax=Clostridium perfringens TaxID=1502 RepID=UPI00237ABF2F|nr:recombinase family protein [Clostridium perfringens]